MNHLWQIWITPRLQLTAIDEMLMFVEVVVIVGLALIICIAPDLYKIWRNGR